MPSSLGKNLLLSPVHEAALSRATDGVARPRTRLKTGVLLAELSCMARYGLVGGLALVSHAATAFGMIWLFDAPVLLSHTVGFMIGFLVAAQGHMTFSFRDRDIRRAARRRYLLVCCAALLVSQMSLLALSIMGVGATLAQTIAIITSCSVSFASARLWAFASSSGQDRASQTQAFCNQPA